MRKLAFTLAEVLITLGIIGVVSAITIPALISKYQEIITVVKVKETYSIMAQASKRWMDEYDCVDDVGGCIAGCTPHSACNLKQMIKYMKVSDVIYKGDGQNRNKKQWLSDKGATALNGAAGQVYWGVNKLDPHYSAQILLPNGVSATFMIDTYAKEVIPIFIDINNSAKPNRIGVDVFPLSLGAYKNEKYKGINPYYGEDGAGGADLGLCATRHGGICNPDDGHSPTAYILKYNKVFNLKKLGY